MYPCDVCVYYSDTNTNLKSHLFNNHDISDEHELEEDLKASVRIFGYSLQT